MRLEDVMRAMIDADCTPAQVGAVACALAARARDDGELRAVRRDRKRAEREAERLRTPVSRTMDIRR